MLRSSSQRDDVDAVVIATPVGTHFALAAAALANGKHVFVEKPLAASTGEAIELMRLARENDRVLMPGHTFLYSPPVVAIHDLIAAGELGEIYFISTSRVNLGLHQPDVSVAWDLGPHDFSILRYWMGETPEHVSAVSRGFVVPSMPDVAFIDLEYEGGTIAHVELSWLAPSKLRRTTIVGSKKMVVYDDMSNEPVRVFDSGVELPDPESFGEYRLTYRTGDVVSPRIDAAEPLGSSCATSVWPSRRARAAFLALLGLEVIRMIEAVDRSLESGGAASASATSSRSARRASGGRAAGGAETPLASRHLPAAAPRGRRPAGHQSGHLRLHEPARRAERLVDRREDHVREELGVVGVDRPGVDRDRDHLARAVCLHRHHPAPGGSLDDLGRGLLLGLDELFLHALRLAEHLVHVEAHSSSTSRASKVSFSVEMKSSSDFGSSSSGRLVLLGLPASRTTVSACP